MEVCKMIIEKAKRFMAPLNLLRTDKFVYRLINSLILHAESKQAEIDSLMWEYCPELMTEEQIKNYEKHQKAVE